jgi:hypothetical protein
VNVAEEFVPVEMSLILSARSLDSIHPNKPNEWCCHSKLLIHAIRLFLSNKKLSMHGADQVDMDDNPYGCFHISSMDLSSC